MLLSFVRDFLVMNVMTVTHARKLKNDSSGEQILPGYFSTGNSDADYPK